MTLREYLESYDEPLNEGIGDKIKIGFNKIKNFTKKALAVVGIAFTMLGALEAVDEISMDKNYQRVEAQREITDKKINKMRDSLAKKEGYYKYQTPKKIGKALHWYYFLENINEKEKELTNKIKDEIANEYKINFNTYSTYHTKRELTNQTGIINKSTYVKDVCDKSIEAYKELEKYAESLYNNLSERDK